MSNNLIIDQHQKTITISILQIKPVIDQFQTNIDIVLQSIHHAAARNIDLLILPELWATGYDLTVLEKSANAFDLINSKIQAICDAENISIAGTYVQRKDDQLYNSLVFHSPKINPRQYDKIHLFGLTGENDVFAHGITPTVIDFMGWQIGLSICYDLRFPELYRLYRSQNVDMVIVSAAWPEARLNHWRILCQARAIENQVYLAACNQMGEGGGIAFGGSSMLISPFGEIITDLGNRENSLGVATCDPEKVKQIRDQMPFHDDMKAHLIGELATKFDQKHSSSPQKKQTPA